MLYSSGSLPKKKKKPAFKGISIDYPHLTDEATEKLKFVITLPEEVTEVRIKITQTPKLVALINYYRSTFRVLPPGRVCKGLISSPLFSLCLF